MLTPLRKILSETPHGVYEAKGDSGEMQNLINQQQGLAQNKLNQTNLQTQGQYNSMFGNYQNAVPRNLGDYNLGMTGYQDFLGGRNPGMGTPQQPNPQMGTQPLPRIIGNDTNPIAPTGMYASEAPATNQGLAGSQQSPNFGDLSDPTKWMSLVGNDNQRTAFARSILPPGAPEELVNYYSDKIKGQPGANTTEQQGSAKYWADKAKQDPIWGGSGSNSNGPSAIGGWQNAIETGMVTPQQQADLRARAVAPIRAAYQQAQDNIDTQRGISGGISPNYNAAQASLARNKAYGMSDAETNANASIVNMVQQGKLAGLGGLTGAQLGALAGQTGLYGATPGLTNMFGNQTLGTNQQNLTGASLQNQLAQILFGGKLGQSQIPGNFQQAMGNIGSGLSLAGNIGSGLSDLYSPSWSTFTST